MAVVRVVVAPVVVPLVQVALLADGVGVQAWQRGGYLGHHGRGVVQLGGGLQRVLEQLADDGHVGGRAIAGHAVVVLVVDVLILGRGRGRGNQLLRVVRVLYEPVEAELCGSPHQRVGHTAQVVAVLCEQVALPQRLHQPGAAHGPVGPLRLLVLLAHGVGHGPDVAVVPCLPASADAVVVLCRVVPVVGQCLHEAVEGQRHLAEVAVEGGPVVLLQVDVDGVVAAPGCIEVRVPQPLQVGGHARRARAADEQVAAVLEVEGLQIAVGGTVTRVVLQEQAVGGGG